MKDESSTRNSEASIEVHWKASVEFRFWLHDPEGDGMCYFRTAADRDAYAKKAIAKYCDDNWAEEVEGVVGGEVTHVATRVNEKQRPPDDEIDEDGIDGDGIYWGDSEIQSQCEYELAPLAPVSERGSSEAPMIPMVSVERDDLETLILIASAALKTRSRDVQDWMQDMERIEAKARTWFDASRYERTKP